MDFPFRYETHFHGAEVSRCAHVSAADMVAHYAQAGYAGCILTDHFLQGNSFANDHIPWQSKVDILMNGFRRAWEAGEALGISVFLGWEGTLDGHDYLTWGLDEVFLRDNADIDKLDPEAYCRLVRSAGGFVSQAHPYREAHYIPHPGPVDPQWLDGVEVFNATEGHEEYNAKAAAFCARHRLIPTAGSDAHAQSAGVSGMAFPYKLSDVDDFLACLRAGAFSLMETYWPRN